MTATHRANTEPRAISFIAATLAHRLGDDFRDQAKTAIKASKNHDPAVWRYFHWLLTDETLNPALNDPAVKEALAATAAVMKRMADGGPLDIAAIDDAASRATRVRQDAMNGGSHTNSANAAAAMIALHCLQATEHPMSAMHAITMLAKTAKAEDLASKLLECVKGA